MALRKKRRLSMRELAERSGASTSLFDSTVPHRVTSVGDVPMKAIWVNWTRVGLRGVNQHAPGRQPPIEHSGA